MLPGKISRATHSLCTRLRSTSSPAKVLSEVFSVEPVRHSTPARTSYTRRDLMSREYPLEYEKDSIQMIFLACCVQHTRSFDLEARSTLFIRTSSVPLDSRVAHQCLVCERIFGPYRDLESPFLNVVDSYGPKDDHESRPASNWRGTRKRKDHEILGLIRILGFQTFPEHTYVGKLRAIRRL